MIDRRLIGAALGLVGLGAGAYFLFEPSGGPRRRRMLGDRAQGLAAQTKARFRHEKVEDAVLVERVRSKMGHVVTNAHPLEVEADQGVVTLRGPVPPAEAEALLAVTRAVPGVASVEDQLERYETGGSSRLQGIQARLTDLKESTPLAQLALGIVGAILALYGGARGGSLGKTLSSLGVSVLTREIQSMSTKHQPKE